MKRLSTLSEKHPLLSILVGFVALVIFALVVLPDNEAQVQSAIAHGSAT